jgi:hypothetical protein
MAKPNGRPSVLRAVIGTRPDGSPITTHERIVDALTVGSFFEQASAAAGVNKQTAYGWLTSGARSKRWLAQGGPNNLTPHEQDCVAFSDAVAEADARWELQVNTLLERLGRGGTTVEVVTVKQQRRERPNPDDPTQPIVDYVELERTTRTETLAPSPQVLEWRLSRRFPTRYSQRMELTGAAGGPIEISREERSAQLAEAAEAYLAGQTDATNGPSPNGQSG